MNDTRFDVGEIGIAVRWLSRLAEDPEKRTFELDPHSKEFVINSTELRAGNIEMDQQEVAGPAVRRSARTAARSAQQAKYLARKYVLPTETEQNTLTSCW